MYPFLSGAPKLKKIAIATWMNYEIEWNWIMTVKALCTFIYIMILLAIMKDKFILLILD